LSQLHVGYLKATGNHFEMNETDRHRVYVSWFMKAKTKIKIVLVVLF